MDTISIVIPVYNLEDFIEATVRSVQAQTYERIEIILVNDGSIDSTPQILERLAKEDVRIRVFHQENSGVTSARLRGVAEATGQWIGFVDGDDWIEPEMYARLLSNALSYQSDISHCGYQMVFPNRVDYYYNTGRLVMQDSRDALLELLKGSFEPSLWNKIFHKSLFHSLIQDKSMDANIRINEDLLMNYYLFREAKRLVFEDICPYHYLAHKGSAANSPTNVYHLRDPMTVREILYRETGNDPELHGICLSALSRQYIRLASMRVQENPAMLTPIRFEARKKLKAKLHSILCDSFCDTKIKAMSIWTVLWPWSFGFVHRLYSHLNGNDRKYAIE